MSSSILNDRLALRPKEAAQALGICERTLRQVLPELPHVRVGSAVLLPVEGLRAWLREQTASERAQVTSVVEGILEDLT
jgi:excisionase family DNA binding protein